MELRIKFVHDDGKESGKVFIHKLVGNELKQIGEIGFSDEADRRWLLAVMTEHHPNVSVIS